MDVVGGRSRARSSGPRRGVLPLWHKVVRGLNNCGDTKVLFRRANKPQVDRVLRVPAAPSRCAATQEDITMTLKHSVSTAILIAALALPVSAFAQTTAAPSSAAPAAPHAAAPIATSPTAAPRAAAPAAAPAAVQASR